MRTLTTLEKYPIYIANSTTWKQKNQIFPPHKRVKIENKNETWRPHAEAKGFTTRPPANGATKSNRRKSNDDDDDDDEKIQQVVWERMIMRILFSVGAPLIFGVALLQVFGAVKEQHLWDVPIWLPYLTTFITFGSSALGIAYGTLSTSWDPERKGSLLGFEEAQQNWVEMWREDDETRE